MSQRLPDVCADRRTRARRHTLSLDRPHPADRPALPCAMRWPRCARRCRCCPRIRTCCTADGAVAASTERCATDRCRRRRPSGRDPRPHAPAARPRRHLCRGPVCRGFANSDGQRNWHAVDALQPGVEPLPPRGQGGEESRTPEPTGVVARGCAGAASARRSPTGRPPKTLSPGKYRAYLAPAAMDEIPADPVSWGGFSGRAQRTKQSALSDCRRAKRLCPARVDRRGHRRRSSRPRSEASRLRAPAARAADRHGQARAAALVSPRTAREFGLAENGANGAEMPSRSP